MRKPKEFKAFEDLLKKVLAVPKEEIDRRDKEWRRNKEDKTIIDKGKRAEP